MAIDKIFDGAVDGIADNLFNSVSNSVSEIKAMQQRKAAENVQLVVQALKKIDADIREKYDGVTETFDKRIASIKDGRDGKDGKNGLDGVNGKDGRDGKDGRNGRDGLNGPRGFDGPKGLDGKDGRDGEDGVSVTDAHIDFDGSLIISLSSGRVINVGEVVAADIAEKIKVITNGGGTSQPVLDQLASLQAQIDLIASALVYKGTWNASTNTPALASSVGTANSFYIVSVAGTTNLNGTSNWGVGDWAVFNGSVWQRIEGGAVGNFTDLTVSGTTTLSNLTASTALALNASKEVVSVTNTGTGNNVLATSPTLVTPALGTPSSATLTNATGLPLSSGVTGTLPILNGGTGQTTANAAFNALAPSQASNSGKYLTTNGTDTSWATLSGLGTVTSVSGTGTVNGLTLTGTVTTSGSLTLGGTLSGISNASLTNSSITINGTATSLGGSINVGTVTSVGATVPSFLSITGSPITSSGTLAIGLSGTALPTTSGGTGLTSFTANGVVYASSTSALTTGSALTFDGSKLVNTGYNKSTYQVSTGAVGTFESVGAAYLTYDGETGASVYSRSNASAENTLTFRATAFSFRVAGTQVASLNSSTFSLQNIPILLSGSTSGYTGFAAPATSNFTIYTLPSADGTSGQSLTTNGSGTLSWASGTGGTVTSVSGTGTVSGISLSGTVTSSGNLTLGGALDLSAYSGAGAFTTLSASSTVTLSGGTANGVAYLNGSKVVTSGSALTFDGTNLALTTTGAIYKVPTAGGSLFDAGGNNGIYILGSSNYIATYVAGSEQMRLTSTGLGIGTSSPAFKLDVNGDAGITASESYLYFYSNYSVGNNSRVRMRAVGAGGGSGYGGDFRLSTRAPNNSWNTDALVVDSSANVGIGTSSPAAYAKLTVAGTAGAQTGASQQIVVNAPTTTAGQGAGIRLTAASGAKEAVAILGVVNQASGNAGAMTFHVYNGGADVPEYMRLDSSGNLGLGVTPSAWSGFGKTMEFNNAGCYVGNSGATSMQVGANNYFNGTNYIYSTTNVATRYAQSAGSHLWYNAPSGTAGNAITFTQAMTLDASGNLGIGTTSPAGRLTLGGSGALQQYFISSSATSQDNAIISLCNNGAAYSRQAFDALNYDFKTSGTSRLQIASTGNVLVTSSASFETSFSGNGLILSKHNVGPKNAIVSIADTSSVLLINNSAAGWDNVAIYTAGSERCRIDSSGNLLVGTTNTTGGALVNFYAASTTIQSTLGNTTSAQNHFVFANPNGNVGTIQVSGSSTSFNTSSDYRLKNTIAPMTGALAKVALLKPCTYKWNADGSDGQGFIAHELAEVVPQCVTGEKDGVNEDGTPKYQGIDTSFLVATLTAALQELNAKFDAYVASHP